MTCEEVIDKEVKDCYQQTVAFLLADGEATLEEINMAKSLEIVDAEMDPFTGLY